ncbi:MAG: Rne/Rng family ribonuclease [Nitrospinaceae bacterium]|nr:Rne/Rng family ribonuclease [Nitrospinaceae bacterium]
MRKTKSAKKVMLINSQHPEECRAVVLDNNIIEDYIVEHSSKEQIKGNIYLGVINRVEPSIEAAFVDFGGKKFGFLPFKDVLKESYVHTGEKKAKVRIQDVLIRGQRIAVQVAKESRDAKGPSLTNGMSLAGRFLVLMQGQGSAVSRKIEDESERKKLKDIVAGLELPEHLGVIIRTAGVGQTKVELQKDLQMLLKIWDKVEGAQKNDSIPGPYLIYQEPELVVRTVRDHFSSDTSEIIVDSTEAYKSLKDFIKLVMPRNRNLVKLYKETKPLFSEYNVEEQIESIYQRTVYLPSGGSIVIDIGEAMASIDVNSGKTKGGLDLEETAVTTNLEAAKEVARQLRLRDLGGLIVIDFIDMFQKKNKAAVEKQMKQWCKTDKARINLARISKFGLLEMSRQRISPPVKEGVFAPCGTCAGSGLVRSVDSIILNVLRKIHELIASVRVKVMTLEISPEISNYILNNKVAILAEIKSKHMVEFRFQIKAGLAYDNFKYTVSEVWDTETVQSEKTEDKPAESSDATEKPRPAGRSRTARSGRGRTSRSPRNRSDATKSINENEVASPIAENETTRPATKNEITKPAVKVEGGLEEIENKGVEGAEGTEPTTKRRPARRPAARRGPQRGRRRRPGQSARKVEGAPVDGNTSEPKNDGNSRPADFSTGDISGNIKSPMPPLPRPFVRENQDMGGESPSTPSPKEPTPPSSDGAAD